MYLGNGEKNMKLYNLEKKQGNLTMFSVSHYFMLVRLGLRILTEGEAKVQLTSLFRQLVL